jgi:cysteine desulfurase
LPKDISMIYLDNNATTRVAPEVFEAMEPFLTDLYGNPSSAHTFGREMRAVIEKARGQVAELVGAAEADEITFTSGGTESDNWALLGALAARPDKKHIVTTRVEHEAVRKLCESLEASGHTVSWLGVNQEGLIDLEELRAALRPDTAVVSIMLANNETGILFPMLQAAAAVKESSAALFHVDGVNAVGKIEVDLKNSGVDLFSLSGHKFHAPKGIGALYVRRGVNLPSLAIGGGQENGRRAGTENVPYIAGLGAAAELVKDISAMERVAAMRDKFEEEVFKTIPNATLNGTADPAFRLPNTSNISFAGANGEAILAKLNDVGICVSTGSACNSDDHTASGVLQAMDIPYEQAMGAIRFSFGRYNAEGEVEIVLQELEKIK